jgi:7,8-dihydro-6-hydroxymethylpterin-pyrophosphokinase
MTGLIILLAIVAAIAAGLEAHYRRVRNQVPYFPRTIDPDLLHEQRDLAAWR